MIYAVLDTNVLVSALLSKSSESTIGKLLKAVIEGRLIPMHSPEIIDEYVDVLSREKFHFLPELRDALISRIKTRGIEPGRISFYAKMPDESDRIFYEVALSKEDSYLVTGNLKHFPVDPIVVTPAEMLDILENS